MWLDEQNRKECSEGITKMFEWEKKRAPECKIPKSIYFETIRELKARIRAEL
jgi:hypothetical protein